MPSAARTRFDEMCAAALADPEAFWGGVAGELPWFRRWDRVFEADPPSFRWFVGGRTNLAFNALDHHVAAGRGDRPALIAVNERGGEVRLTYAQLLAEVERAAAGLRALGIGRGDRLTIYMPTCAEAVVAMLATVRIGAIHSVVFAGFGHGALADRVIASGSRAILTTDLTYRKGNDVPLLGIVRAAVEQADREAPGLVERVVVLRRGTPPPALHGPRELDWDAFLAGGAGHSGAHEEMEANEPAYILATSGTTAKPKLAVHVHGGYQVHIVAMGRWVMGLRPDDVFWATADIGWAVGHAYTVYAPLIIGCASVAYEGALDYPATDSAWALMERLGTTGIFTSPTAVRLLMRYGEAGAKAHDLSRIERVVCAGEVLNAPAWEWLQQGVFEDRIPVIDHMWQTETGGPIFGNPYGTGLLPIKPGSAGLPLPGIDAAIVALDGRELGRNEKGIMVIRRPFPGLTPTLWGDPERYARDYWSRIPGSYWVGDAASIDDDGYAFFAGRADEIIKIASHRMGTIEVETAFLRNPAVAEAGVTGRPDELRGEVIAAFIVLRSGRQASAELEAELRRTVREELGPIAVIGELTFVDMLPKTRSGKIMRRVLKAVVEGRDPGDITTIEDEGSVDEARRAMEELRAAVIAARPAGAGSEAPGNGGG